MAAAPETKVTFQNKQQQKLIGIFTDAGSDKVVLLSHGYASHKDGFVYPKLAKALAARRLCSLRFDFTGNGESEGAFEVSHFIFHVDWTCHLQMHASLA